MSSRAYLSIGDVLTLLREEFPDVTISKIRFLESQGLVNPERSPSGYRKFYEHDVERLRWVLRQQREHFLPLKVIRDRLASEGIPDPEPVGATVGAPEGHLASVGAAPLAEASAPRAPASVGMVHQMSSLGPRNGGPTGTLSGVSDPAVAVAGLGAPAPREVSATSTHVVDREAGEPGPRPDRPAERGASSPGEPGEPGALAPSDPGPVSAAPDPPEAEAAGSGRVGPGEDPSVESAGPAEPAVPRHAGTRLPGTGLTLEELCAASGLSAEEVRSLDSFGLIEPTVVAGVTYYDDEALAIGRLAAEFARYGIEPRHLRLYRNAADREIGLVEQVVTPLLRQRNPEARQRALEAAGDITRLGQGLRSSLVRQALRRELGN